MSIAGRSTLISSGLNSAPIYHMSIYLLPKTVINELDKVRRTFFWQGVHSKRKYHLVRWTKNCKSNKKRGLGIKDIRKMYLSLLCKWWRKLEKESGLWQDIVTYKYLKRDTWLYSDPLCLLFLDLFKICDQQTILVFQLVSGTIHVTFCRWLTAELKSEWDKLLKMPQKPSQTMRRILSPRNYRAVANFH